MGHNIGHRTINRYFLIFILALLSPATQAGGASQPQTLKILVSNTASQSGLIHHLANAFEAQNRHIKIEIDSAGALAVLDKARLGHAGLVITHHPPSEKLFMDEGFGLSRTLIMYNQFALFGPPGDPLGLVTERELLTVLRILAENQVPFMVPGARSGTQKKLAELWSLTGVEPNWPGYEITGSSSAATLRNAAIFNAYAFADIATYLANIDKLHGMIIPIYRDHTALRNYYSAIVVNGQHFPHFTQQALAQSFINFLVSDAGQFLIKRFGETNFNTTIFTPAAHLDPGIKTQHMKHELETKRQHLQVLSGLAIILAILSLATSWLFFRTRGLEKSTRLSEERFELAVAASNDGIWDWDIENDIAYFSPRTNEILNQPLNQAHVMDPLTHLISCINAGDRDKLQKQIKCYFEKDDNTTLTAEFRLPQDTNKQTKWIKIRGKIIKSSQGKPLRMSGAFTDITDIKRSEFHALHDILTGLPNRALLQNRLDQAILSFERNKKIFSLLMIDLDRFKQVNDIFGHQTGDALLTQVAVRLRACLRKSDTVARLGGDEFAILLPGSKGDYACNIAEKILKTTNKIFYVKPYELNIGASIGIAIFPVHGQDAHTLIKHADIAMYKAKSGHEKIKIFDNNKYFTAPNNITSATID